MKKGDDRTYLLESLAGFGSKVFSAWIEETLIKLDLHCNYQQFLASWLQYRMHSL